HFEVHAHDGKAWTIIAALEDVDAAKNNARSLFAAGKHRAVKVTKERYNDDKGTYASLTIVSHGNVPTSKRIAERHDPSKRINVCRKPTDLYTYEGRRSIRLQIGNTLDHWAITPTELLHDPDYYLKLDNAGTLLQNAIQRTAVQQIQGTDVPVQERMRELYDVLGQAYGDLKKLLASNKLANLQKFPIEKVAEQLSEEHQRTTLFSAALAAALKQEADIWAKFTFTLTHLKKGLPGWVIDVLDTLFAELMQTPAILRGIMESQKKSSELERMLGLVHLRHGKAALDGFDVFNEFITGGKMPNTETALQQLLLQQMRSSNVLSDGDLADHLDAITEIKEACSQDLEKEDAFSGEVFEAISKRCQKALSTHSVNTYMAAAAGPLDRAERLLKLAPKVIGKQALKQLAEQLSPILVPYDQQVLIRKNAENPLETMTQLRKLQVLLGKAEFAEQVAKDFNGALDNMCLGLLQSTRLIQKLEKSEMEQWQKAMKLLDLLAKATFVEGQSASGIRKTTREIMRGSGLIDELMKSAKTQQDQVMQLQKLMDLLTRAGMGASAAGLAA
ncbi:MAG: hypothetical protein AAF337_13660, partial [Pseudomonadota bacterium]